MQPSYQTKSTAQLNLCSRNPFKPHSKLKHSSNQLNRLHKSFFHSFSLIKSLTHCFTIKQVTLHPILFLHVSFYPLYVEGFDTYKYYEGNDVLRSWICIPLTVGIQDRKDATIQALFSPRLWTENGLLTQAGSETFWDRSTLYALRGVYACGETEKATDYLRFYSSQRLLGEHVPYAIEAWPEGNQRHLSAESGLYCRIITEVLLLGLVISGG